MKNFEKIYAKHLFGISFDTFDDLFNWFAVGISFSPFDLHEARRDDV